jgi:hypothetical protein
LQVAQASLKGLASGTRDGLHTSIISEALASAALPRPRSRDQLELDALNKYFLGETQGAQRVSMRQKEASPFRPKMARVEPATFFAHSWTRPVRATIMPVALQVSDRIPAWANLLGPSSPAAASPGWANKASGDAAVVGSGPVRYRARRQQVAPNPVCRGSEVAHLAEAPPGGVGGIEGRITEPLSRPFAARITQRSTPPTKCRKMLERGPPRLFRAVFAVGCVPLVLRAGEGGGGSAPPRWRGDPACAGLPLPAKSLLAWVAGGRRGTAPEPLLKP